ncbi:bile acid:sodium symporter family protein [Roseovarius sp. CAU 1744]|uniref:bile acid:sodium symporter family protein n=1 Tax=Roseovarius sp. CAU 1744 TaxID=3140368 RepID=UPI00325C0228
MDFAIQVILPAAQAFIMFSLGLGLTLADFGRVFRGGKALLIGIVCQIVLLPIVAFGIVSGFDLPPVLAAGAMLVAFCPGGVSSNVITKLARGDLALAVSLTAVTSLIAFMTVPPLAALAIVHFMGEAAPEFSISNLAVFTFVLTTVPVMTGVLVRHVFAAFSIRVEKFLSNLAVILWLILLVFLFVGNWDLVARTFEMMGPALLLLPFVLMVMGWGAGRLLGVSRTQSKTLSIETSIQNSPLGVALAGAIMGTTAGISELALPSGLYSITMYVVALPAILLFRRIDGAENSQAGMAPASS